MNLTVSSTDENTPFPDFGSGYSEVCEILDDLTERIIRKKDGAVILEITNSIDSNGQVLTSTEKSVT